MKKIEIHKKDLSPLWIKIIGALVVLATLYKIVTLTFFEVNILIYILFNALAIVSLVGKEVVVIDFQKKEIGEGYKVFELRYLTKTRFSGIEKIFINRVHLAETFWHMGGTMDIRHVRYKAFLKTTERDKICIGISADKEALIENLKSHNRNLRTTIIDNTFAEPVTVE
jgi:hypothetical protein